MSRKILLSLAAFCCMASPTLADLSIVVPNNIPLLPNTAGQIVTVSVTGGDQIQGLNFAAQIGGGTEGPIITAVDIIGAGTIFAPNNTGQGTNIGDALPSQFVYLSTTTTGVSTISGSGVLARLTLTTVGVVGTGPFLFDLSTTPFGPTDFADDGITVSITNGSFLIVPEPASMLLGVFAAAGLGVVLLRRRQC